MTKTLETVQSFWSTEEAYLARNRLESEGIRAELSDESVAGLWAYTVAMGGIKLLVSGEDAERAAAILDADDSTQEGARSAVESTALIEAASPLSPIDETDPETEISTEAADEDEAPGLLTTLRGYRSWLLWDVFGTLALAMFFAACEVLEQLLGR